MTFSKVLLQSLIWRGVYFLSLFAVNLVLSRYLQANGSGIIYYISNTFVLIQLIAGLSFENGITYFAAGRRVSTNKLVWFCLFWTAVVILLQVIAYSLFTFRSEIIASQKIPQYAFCFITGSLLSTYFANVFYSTGNFSISNVIFSVVNLLFVLFVLMSQRWHRATSESNIIDAYFYVFLLQGVFTTIACVFKNKSWREFQLPHLSEIKTFIRYSSAVLLFNLLLFFVYRIDYYFVRYSPVCTPSDLGNYIQASKLGQMMLVIPQVIGSAVYPQVSSGKDMENVSRLIVVLIKLIAFLFLLFFLLICLAGKQLFPFMFGDTFQNVQVPFLLLLPGIFGLSVISFLSNYFSGQGNVSVSVRAAVIALPVVLIGDSIFVSRYGIIAAAAVSMIGYLIMCSPYLIKFVKQQKLSSADFFRFQKSDWLLLSSVWKR